MREILPGNPTEAGPESRNEPPPSWLDLMMYAEEESCFARRRFTVKTERERKQLIDVMRQCQQHYAEAEQMLIKMEDPHGPKQ